MIMADILGKDAETFQKEKDSFLRDLKQFHESKNTPLRQRPHINGKEIDLYLLYVLVTNRGGWIKVNQRNEWHEILDNFDPPRHCVNSGVALKQIYLRYLDRYEKIHFLGESLDHRNGGDDDDDVGSSKHRRASARNLHPVPQSYNYNQHDVPDVLRTTGGLATNLYESSDYDKIGLSLMCGLPNEEDFAINVCAMLSDGDGKTSLRFSQHPRLIHFLLAHAAVYNHHSMRATMEANYKETRGNSQRYFWSDVVEDKELMILMDEKKYVRRRKLKMLTSLSDDSRRSSSEDEDEVEERPNVFTNADKELFCLSRGNGTHDFMGQRVLQIATIMRNASFEEENAQTMAGDVTFLRFALLCCAARWDSLHQLGFEMLGNVSGELTLDDVLMDHLIHVVGGGLDSSDRAVVIACVETINKLALKEANEEFVLQYLDGRIYEKICLLLSLPDIRLLIHTLECLYALSSLGERSCNEIVHVHGIVEILISLVTIEAQSYGQKACILMRVVSRKCGTEGSEHETTTSGVSSSTSTPSSSSSSTLSLQTPSIPNIVTPTVIQAVPMAVPVSMPVVSIPAIAAPSTTVLVTVPATVNSSPAVVVAAPSQNIRPAPTKATPVAIAPQPQPQPSVTPISATATGTAAPPPALISTPVVCNIAATQQENENFAMQWLFSTFEARPTPGRGIEQGEMYKQYLNACNKAGRKGGYIAPAHFPACVKKAFGNDVGPRQVIPAHAVGNKDMMNMRISVYEGIQVRNYRAVTIGPPSTMQNQVAAVAKSGGGPNPMSPILKAQLSNPAGAAPSVIVTKKEAGKSKVTTSHPHLSSVLMNASCAQQNNNQQQQQQPPLQVIQKVGNAAPIASATATTMTTAAVMAAVGQQQQDSSSSSSNTSLIKSLLASKVCDTKGQIASPVVALPNTDRIIIPSSSSGKQLVYNATATINLQPQVMQNFVRSQVTQRQQQQQQRIVQQQPDSQHQQQQQIIQVVQQPKFVQMGGQTVLVSQQLQQHHQHPPPLQPISRIVQSTQGIQTDASMQTPSARKTVEATGSISVITSAASAVKPVVAKINGLKNFPHTVILDKNELVLLNEEKLQMCPPDFKNHTVLVKAEPDQNGIVLNQDLLCGSSLGSEMKMEMPTEDDGLITDIENDVLNKIMQEDALAEKIIGEGAALDDMDVGGNLMGQQHQQLQQQQQHLQQQQQHHHQQQLQQKQQLQQQHQKQQQPPPVSIQQGKHMDLFADISKAEETNTRPINNQSQMLAELLEKSPAKKKEPPMLNGGIRAGDKITVAATNAIISANTVNSSSGKQAAVVANATVVNKCGVKRPADQHGSTSSHSEAKKAHIVNGAAVKDEELADESNVKASSSAANLYAALAADVLGDIDNIDEEETLTLNYQGADQQQTQQQTMMANQLYLTTGSNARQILLGGPSSSSLATGNMPATVAVSTAGQAAPSRVQLLREGSQLVLTQSGGLVLAPNSSNHGNAPKTFILVSQNPAMTAGTTPVNLHQGQKGLFHTVQQSKTAAVAAAAAVVPRNQTVCYTNSNGKVTQMARSDVNIAPKPQQEVGKPPLQQVKVITQGKGVAKSQMAQGVQTQPQLQQQQQHVPVNNNKPVTAAATACGGGGTQQQAIQTRPVTHTVSQSTQVMEVPQVSAATAATAAAASVVKQAQKFSNRGQYLCEWRSCMRSFRSTTEVYLHVCASHCPSGSEEIQCLWEKCDAMKRKRLSLMTHLYDRHCNPDMLKRMAERRKELSQTGRTGIPLPAPPSPHPGYAPNAALHAIKRHALEFVNPKALQDDNEGPVTKSIRLTSSLILRNLVIYSGIGKGIISGYEPHLATIALSNVESSRTIAQLLYDLNHHHR